MAQMRLFQGPGFVLMVPSTWLVASSPEYQAAFVGPQIGSARAGFVINMQNVVSETVLSDIVTRSREEQETLYEQYVVLEERDISQDSYQAYQRYFHWYNPEINMVIFQRQVFILSLGVLYILVSTQPNSDHVAELDELFVTMINSFRVGRLEL